MIYRKPKRRDAPARMCYQCREWTPCRLDWGDCFWMGEAVPGDEYRLMYAYDECAFECRDGGDMWKPREELRCG